jgi:hypothetical protein
MAPIHAVDRGLDSIQLLDHHQHRRRTDRRQAHGHPGGATRSQPGQQLSGNAALPAVPLSQRAAARPLGPMLRAAAVSTVKLRRFRS